MAAREQDIKTGRLSFWLSTAAGWLTWTALLILAAVDASTVERLREQLVVMLLISAMWAVAAASVGALVGLLFGSPLSRFYFIVLGVASAAWTAPLLFWLVVLWWPGVVTMRAMTIVPAFYVLWGGSVVAGLVGAVMLMRHRVGFSGASTRAARRTFLFGVPAIVLCVGMVQYARGRHVDTESRVMWIVLAAVLSVSLVALAAMLTAERPSPSGFAVLPLPASASVNVQTASEATAPSAPR